MRKYLGALMLSVLLVLTLALPVLADNGNPPPFGDLTDLVGALEVVRLGGLALTISIWLGKWAWYNEIEDNRIKTAIELGLLVGLPLLAKVLLDFVPQDVWLAVQDYYSVVVTSLLYAFPVSELHHRLVVKPERIRDKYDEEYVATLEIEHTPGAARNFTINNAQLRVEHTSENLGREILGTGE